MDALSYTLTEQHEMHIMKIGTAFVRIQKKRNNALVRIIAGFGGADFTPRQAVYESSDFRRDKLESELDRTIRILDVDKVIVVNN